ncbi:MAG: DUF421 domain-containing protein [Bacilli bacterium]|nr:DUF421 domain-containing protein [Bacilli bacterium]MDD3896136.1 DUF421 domain-containing protein [Bacilli bacterium]MDD4408101.1 DUF421 domain-containing protein [Bacilli bacterium]
MIFISAIIRTVFFYFFVTICFRVMGKREIGKLGVIDLIVSILIAELCAISIENINDSIFLAVLPILVLVGIEVLFAKISLKSRKFRTIVSGRTSLIINQGKINYKEMIKQRYTLDDLLLSLRQEQIKNIEDVEYAFLENNGRLSIFKYNMFKIKGNYPLPIIIDGIIQKDTLKDIKKSSLWLKMYLKKQQLLLEDVFYAFYKGSKIYIIKKSDLIV